MATGKVALCRREHPEVTLSIWHDLPALVSRPLAVVPSIRRDGTLIVVLVVSDSDGEPIVVPIVPGGEGKPNVILSIYSKAQGFDWAAKQIAYATQERLPLYIDKDFAASMPQPPVAEATSSSPGPIPADGTAKPMRSVLTLGRKVNDRE